MFRFVGLGDCSDSYNIKLHNKNHVTLFHSLIIYFELTTRIVRVSVRVCCTAVANVHCNGAFADHLRVYIDSQVGATMVQK